MDSKLTRPRLSRWFLGVSVLAAVALLVMGSDATAQSASDSTTLLWTAPGDDGTVGRATSYDIRYRSTAIVGADTLSWWNAATLVANLPSPGVAGATDSVVVRGLDPARTYWFILRTADEIPNWSGFSNVAIKLPSVDVVRPAAITDLGVGGSSTSTAETAGSRPGGPPKP